MPASQQQKVDYLLKKVGYSISKTGIAEDSSLSGTVKAPFAETIPSPLILRGEIIWSQSDNIPVPTPPTASTQYVKAYAPGVTSSFQMTVDSTVSGNRTFVARQIVGVATSPNVGDWVDAQFSTNYTINVYAGSPQGGGGTLISNDTWFFDYSSGVLNFNGDTTPAQLGITTNNVFIVGWRYIGAKGVLSSGGQAETDLSVASLSVSGVSTLGITSASNLRVSGITTLGITSASNLNVSGVSTFGNGTTGVKIDGVNGIVTSTNSGATTVTFVGNLTGTATTSGFAGTAFNLDTSSAINVKVGFATTARDVIGGIGSLTDLKVTGISTFGNASIGIKIDGTTGIITSNTGIAITFIGNLTGTASTAGFAATAFSLNGFTPSTGSVGFATTATNVIGGIGSLSQLSVSGLTTVGVLTATRIGIGTTNPTAELFVVGNSRISGIVTVGVGSTGVVINAGIITSSNPGFTTVTYFGDGSNLTGIKGVSVEFQSQTAETLFPTLAANSGVSSIGIATTGSTAFCYIPSSGNIGIGTTNPTSKLFVNGNVFVSGIATVGIGSSAITLNGTSGIITASGVGTVTYFGDGSKLTGIKGVTVEFQAQTAETLFPTLAANSGVSSIGIATTGFTAFCYIPSSGNIGIGTTTPTAKLTVNGNASISGITTVGVGTIGVVIDGTTGIITSINPLTTVTFVGNLTGTASTTSFATTSFTLNGRTESQFNVAFAQTAGISTNVIGGIGSITQLSVSGVTTSGEFIGGGSYLRNLQGTNLVSYSSHSESSNSSSSISGISTYTEIGILSGTLSIDFEDQFGYSVATSADGKTIVVGARRDELNESNLSSGIVYVFDRTGNSFNQVGILTGTLTSTSDFFGSSVATSADGKTIIVGSTSDGLPGLDSTGLVYVFDRVGNLFNQVGILTGFNAIDAGDNFGVCVTTSSDGKTIIVGASADEIGATGSTGVVYVFDRSVNSFNQVGILTGSLAVDSSDLFGFSVATSADGKTIAVGAKDDEVPGSNTATGVVYVFDRSVNSFNQVGILTGTFSTQAGDRFGNSIAISADGKKIVIGAMDDEIPSPSSSGAVYVFNRVGNTFNRVASFRGSLAIDGQDFFGNSVAVSADGKSIIAGAFQDSLVLGDLNGIAYVFDEVKETYLHSNPQGNIGIGTSNPTSKLQVLGGDIRVGINTSQGVILTSPDGTKYRLIVANGGTLSTVVVP